MLREDGTPVAPEDITDEDARLRRWNVLEYLRTEEEIRAYLDEALKEAPGDAPFYCRCLVEAAQARIINELARETGADRRALCDLFLACSAEASPPEAGIDIDVIERLSGAFAVPLPAPVMAAFSF